MSWSSENFYSLIYINKLLITEDLSGMGISSNHWLKILQNNIFKILVDILPNYHPKDRYQFVLPLIVIKSNILSIVV